MTEPFDWNGDHIHTNFKDLYDTLRAEGYFIEVLGYPFTCFDAKNYGTLLLVDPEEEYFPEEIEKLHTDIEKNDLSVLVISDWYNEEVIDKIKFFDDGSKQWWTPVTGGSNIPAINDLLQNYHISFGKIVYDGKVTMGESSFYFASGAGISSFPRNGVLIPFELTDQSIELIENKKETHKVPIIGLYQIPTETSSNLDSEDLDDDNNTHAGRIVVFGDSSCLDSSNKLKTQDPSIFCYWLIKELLLYTSKGLVSNHLAQYPPLQTDYVSQRLKAPERIPGNKLSEFSKVTGKNKQTEWCIQRSFTSVNLTYDVKIKWDQNNAKNSGMFRESNDKSGTSDIPSKNLPYWIILGAVVLSLPIIFYILNYR